MNLSKTIWSRRINPFLIAAIILLTLCCGADKKEKIVNASSMETKIDKLIGLYADYEGFNGSILVAHKGNVVYKKGFGWANMEGDIPNQVTTKFRIASITKSFTALLILQLVAEGKLDLHTPIATYLPDYPKKNAEQLTLHHLLTHSSGIVRDYKSTEKLNPYPDRQRPEQSVKEFWELPLEFSPGTQFAYSNAGYAVLAYIIETTTAKPYQTVLQEKILTPLDMKNTGVELHRPIIKNRAKGYFKSFGDYYNANYIDMSNITGVGNMYSTVEDLFLWDQALYSEKLLPKKFLDILLSKHIIDATYGGHYGYGWELIEKPIGNTNNKIETVGHSGAIDGFCSLFTRIPSSNSSIILLNNTRRAYLGAITTAVTGILNDTTYDFPKKPLAKIMSQVIAKEGVEKGITYFKKHRSDPNYYVAENELIVAGYRLLQAGNANHAAKVFKLSIEVFPDRDNPYDSYAEALLVVGDTVNAVRNYKKSLQLNPNNNNAKRVLEKLGK